MRDEVRITHMRHTKNCRIPENDTGSRFLRTTQETEGG